MEAGSEDHERAVRGAGADRRHHPVPWARVHEQDVAVLHGLGLRPRGRDHQVPQERPHPAVREPAQPRGLQVELEDLHQGQALPQLRKDRLPQALPLRQDPKPGQSRPARQDRLRLRAPDAWPRLPPQLLQADPVQARARRVGPRPPHQEGQGLLLQRARGPPLQEARAAFRRQGLHAVLARQLFDPGLLGAGERGADGAQGRPQRAQ
mmetsp:Transcript_8758/g.14861  ORF Transcript_8758/g.14861 Transcript_8758/m.14861 type:complete len:208 (-) Transcript_8758:34-657(-)